MSELWVILLLGLVAGSLLVLVGTVVATARDIRETSHRVRAAVPSWERACHEVEHTFGQTRRVLASTGRGVRGAAQAVGYLRDATASVLDDLSAFKEHVSHWLGKPLRNGTRSGPRRHARRSPNR